MWNESVSHFSVTSFPLLSYQGTAAVFFTQCVRGCNCFHWEINQRCYSLTTLRELYRFLMHLSCILQITLPRTIQPSVSFLLLTYTTSIMLQCGSDFVFQLFHFCLSVHDQLLHVSESQFLLSNRAKTTLQMYNKEEMRKNRCTYSLIFCSNVTWRWMKASSIAVHDNTLVVA